MCTPLSTQLILVSAHAPFLCRHAQALLGLRVEEFVSQHSTGGSHSTQRTHTALDLSEAWLFAAAKQSHVPAMLNLANSLVREQERASERVSEELLSLALAAHDSACQQCIGSHDTLTQQRVLFPSLRECSFVSRGDCGLSLLHSLYLKDVAPACLSLGKHLQHSQWLHGPLSDPHRLSLAEICMKRARELQLPPALSEGRHRQQFTERDREGSVSLPPQKRMKKE